MAALRPISPASQKAEEGRIEETSVDRSPTNEGVTKHGDAALDILGDTITQDISPEQDAAVLRKIDLWVMPVVLVVYFLQQLDKYGASRLAARLSPKGSAGRPCRIPQFSELFSRLVRQFILRVS